MGQLFTYLLLSKHYRCSTLIVQGSGYSHRVMGGCCPSDAPMSPCATSAEGPCPHWDKGILKMMHQDFSKQNSVLYQNAYSQERSTPFS